MRTFLNLIIGAVLLVTAGHAESNLEEIEKNIEDSVITAKITAKFAKNHILNPLKIHVSTDNGVVTLSGYIKNSEGFVNALRLAKSTKGVKSVETDDLLIKQVNTSLTDAYITAKVEAAVLKAKVLDDESIPIVGINASTSNGTVTLSGDVKRNKSIVAIIKRVNNVRGVKKIISRLKVNNKEV